MSDNFGAIDNLTVSVSEPGAIAFLNLGLVWLRHASPQSLITSVQVK